MNVLLHVWVINATLASQQNDKAALSGMLAAISSVIAYDYSWPKTVSMCCLEVTCPWFSTRLQYLECVSSNRDTAVLHSATDIFGIHFKDMT